LLHNPQQYSFSPQFLTPLAFLRQQAISLLLSKLCNAKEGPVPQHYGGKQESIRCGGRLRQNDCFSGRETKGWTGKSAQQKKNGMLRKCQE
jgi:hypothetical protein